ncbi:MAG: DUF3078 domain-containing protein [Microscillaceae bacterium]|jgi:hypothetical protein|nr:DUF3078 domain-containing protein [Microscillaceae bacterium]
MKKITILQLSKITSFFVFLIFGLIHSTALAQSDSTKARSDTSYWQKSFSGGLNFNQASFSNWVGGGANSMALGIVVNARALYMKEKWSWDNTADLQLGYVYQAGVTRKAADQILLNSVAGYKIASKWDVFMSGNFSTFFAPGYLYGGKKDGTGGDSLVSSFMAPAQLALAWGVAYKPNDWFSLRISPFAPRFTFLMNDEVRPIINGQRTKAYGVEADRNVRTEWLAFQLQAALNKDIAKNIKLNILYQMYANYETLSFDQIDHRLNLSIAAKVNNYISTTFGVIMLYDKDFSDKLQLQQTLGIGFLYNVSTFKKK